MPGRRTAAAAAAGTDAGRISINRAPVLTLWAAVVAERLGYDRDEAVTLGRAVAGLNAASKARTLGLAQPRKKRTPARKGAIPPARVTTIELCGRQVPAVRTRDGVRALAGDKLTAPDSVHRYLADKFGEALPAVRAAMTRLAKSLPKDELAAQGFALYEDFRPGIPRGVKGWGARGVLDLARIRALAR